MPTNQAISVERRSHLDAAVLHYEEVQRRIGAALDFTKAAEAEYRLSPQPPDAIVSTKFTELRVFLENPLVFARRMAQGAVALADPLEEPETCKQCGRAARVDAAGIANHLTQDGGIDHDADAHHVALVPEDVS
jgi:hypothetical protein